MWALTCENSVVALTSHACEINISHVGAHALTRTMCFCRSGPHTHPHTPIRTPAHTFPISLEIGNVCGPGGGHKLKMRVCGMEHSWYCLRMSSRNLYVGPRQEGVWRRAELIAQAEGVSLSSLVGRALGAYIGGHMAVEHPPPADVPPVVGGAPQAPRPVAADEHRARRMAVRLWRIAGENPGLTLGVMRCRFAGKERHLFPLACAIAEHQGWIVRDGAGLLRRGQREPEDVPVASGAVLADQVDEALRRLQADDEMNEH